MRLAYSLLCSLVLASALSAQASSDPARWERQAQNVTIIRDDWGIPHVYGKTDADVVFGLMYAQAEDDFNRVETNFINAMGRLAEAEGESAIFRDLRMKLFINPDTLQKLYRESPEWLRALMNAWADGLNFYLYKNPQVKPRVLTRFEPWMALSFSEGSIGGDIERVSIPSLRAFYSSQRSADSSRQDSGGDDAEPKSREPGGSNGIALGPQVTRSGNTMLLINPHTSFFFRAEAQVVSEEGLNAYGALTWGQFFIYQGFNDKAGWMHTSSSVDNIDEYLETIVERNGRRFYRVGTKERALIEKRIVVPFKAADGSMKSETFTAYYTHRGPIVRQINGKWVSVAMMNSPLKALTQSYSRTKARNIDEYKKVMALHTNSSNNTLYADASGNYAYFHSNFVPRRDPSFDWQRPVDGSNPATEWKGLHTFEESPNVINPPNGWVYNSNNYPYSAAGPYSPKKANFPAYMDAGSENPRGVHAVMVLKDKKDFTLQGLIAAAFDSYLPAFDDLLPPLFRDFDASAGSPTKQKVTEAVGLLKAWDRRWAIPSVPTSLAVFYGDEIQRTIASAATAARMTSADYAATRATPAQRLGALAAALDSLTASFGSWKTPWGEINRFQRISSEIVHPFDDSKPSIPVAFASARFGSLASFGAAPRNGTRKWYGTSGNSFVAVVEFGKDSVRARAVTAGGQSGHVGNKHFNDQAERYATGNLRPVYFYRSQLQGHIEREYKPGS
jgi:acyl-homoserine-lactone acylase